MKNQNPDVANRKPGSDSADTTVIDANKGESVQLALDNDQFSKKAIKNASRIAKRVYVGESPIHGKGLFAKKRLKADVSLGRVHGMLTESDGTYVLWLDKNLGLELTNEFRFINHDSDPNCAIVDTEVITLRKIEKDEELTHDYGW